MTDWIDSGVRPGSVVVDNGIDVVPIDPDEGGGAPGKRPCRITVRLRGVAYQGDDVGADWRYTVAVNSSTWISRRHTAVWRRFDEIGVEIDDQVWPNSCGGAPLLVISAHAREYDGGLFDDVGFNADIIAMPCTRDGFRRQLTMVVPVPEYPPRFWRWILRRPKRVALMVFFFVIEARCVE